MRRVLIEMDIPFKLLRRAQGCVLQSRFASGKPGVGSVGIFQPASVKHGSDVVEWTERREEVVKHALIHARRVQHLVNSGSLVVSYM